MRTAWKLAWLAHDQEISKSDARRMVEGSAFEFAGEKVTDPNTLISPKSGDTFKAGRADRSLQCRARWWPILRRCDATLFGHLFGKE